MNYKKSQAKDASRAQFRGIWAAITTPFTPDLALDEAGLRAQHALPHRDAACRRRVLHRRDGRVLVAHQGRAQAHRRDRGRRGARQMRRHRPDRQHLRARDRRADAACRGGRRRLRDHDDAVLSAHRRGDGLRLVRVRRRARQYRHLAVRHALFRSAGDLAGDDRAAGADREHLRRQDRAPARALSRGAAAVRRQDRHELAVGNRFPDDDARPRPARASILGLAVPDPDRRLAADARLRRAGACRAGSPRPPKFRRRSTTRARSPSAGCTGAGTTPMCCRSPRSRRGRRCSAWRPGRCARRCCR